MMKPPMSRDEFTASSKDYEDEMDAVFVEKAPKGKFSKATMNELVRAFRSAQTLMGFGEEDMYPEFTEQVVSEFPPEFVRGLAMLATAAEDYGQPGLIDLSAVRTDAEVAMLASKILSLVEDPEFVAFLEAPPEGGSMGSEIAEESVPEDDMDAMFMSRS
jgi:hypothetical protein